jgi:hypothetical protein
MLLESALYHRIGPRKAISLIIYIIGGFFSIGKKIGMELGWRSFEFRRAWGGYTVNVYPGAVLVLFG